MSMSLKNLAHRFPPNFRFGAATASYQIEGAISEGGRTASIWDVFSATPGKVRNGDTGAIACDHFNRLDQDLDLIAGLGLDMYRFSLSWSRLLPERNGSPNPQGIAFYDRMIDGLLARGIAPNATLYHWDLPVYLMEDGGWTDRDTAHVFADYAAQITRLFGDRLSHIATLNEPWCSWHLGYETGIHAPGMRDQRLAMAALHHLNLAHGLGVQAIRAEAPQLPIGIALNPKSLYAQSAQDKAARNRSFLYHVDSCFGPLFRGSYDPQFLDAMDDTIPFEPGDEAIIHQRLDWWGVNYYCPETVCDAQDTPYPHAVQGVTAAHQGHTDIGWEILPCGFSDLLSELYQSYELPPCIITENGACYNIGPDADGKVQDQARINYLNSHLSALADAMDAGIPVTGYFAWSLMDNFEWAEGYDMRFGLTHVDYDTQSRTPKASAYWYQNLIAEHRSTRG